VYTYVCAHEMILSVQSLSQTCFFLLLQIRSYSWLSDETLN